MSRQDRNLEYRKHTDVTACSSAPDRLRARPKSPSLHSPSLVRKMFKLLISLQEEYQNMCTPKHMYNTRQGAMEDSRRQVQEQSNDPCNHL